MVEGSPNAPPRKRAHLYKNWITGTDTILKRLLYNLRRKRRTLDTRSDTKVARLPVNRPIFGSFPGQPSRSCTLVPISVNTCRKRVFAFSEDRLKQLPSASERRDSRDRFKQPQRFPRQIKHYWHFRIKFNLLLGKRQSAKSLNSGWRILYTEIGRVFAVPDTKEIRGSTSASFRAKESRYPSRAATHRETSAATHYV